MFGSHWLVLASEGSGNFGSVGKLGGGGATVVTFKYSCDNYENIDVASMDSCGPVPVPEVSYEVYEVLVLASNEVPVKTMASCSTTV